MQMDVLMQDENLKQTHRDAPPLGNNIHNLLIEGCPSLQSSNNSTYSGILNEHLRRIRLKFKKTIARYIITLLQLNYYNY